MVTELIQTGSYNTVVANCDKTSGLSNVDYVAERKISLRKSHFGSIFQYFVPEVPFCLQALVLLLEPDACTLRTNILPSHFINHRLSRTELHFTILVEIYDSRSKDTSVGKVLHNISRYLICNFTQLNESKLVAWKLDSHSSASDMLHVSGNDQISLLGSSFFILFV